MNRVSLVGRLTSKPELRYTNSQIPYTKFSVAVTRPFNRDETDFINVTVWRKPAESICNYLDKGSLVSVDGRIQTGSYTDKDGSKKYTFDVVSDSVNFLESKSQSQSRGTSDVNNSKASEKVNPYDFQSDYQDFGSSDDIYSNMGDSISLDDADID